MKKRAKLVVMVLGIALVLAGCGQDTSGDKESEAVTQGTTQNSTQAPETKESNIETESAKETMEQAGTEAESESGKETGNEAQTGSDVADADEGKLLEEQRHLQMILYPVTMIK